MKRVRRCGWLGQCDVEVLVENWWTLALALELEDGYVLEKREHEKHGQDRQAEGRMQGIILSTFSFPHGI